MQTLIQYDRQSRADDQQREDFWKKRLAAEREQLNQNLQSQQEELRKVIESARMEEFPINEPHVVMMTDDL